MTTSVQIHRLPQTTGCFDADKSCRNPPRTILIEDTAKHNEPVYGWFEEDDLSNALEEY
jgi:hypothetical protein